MSDEKNVLSGLPQGMDLATILCMILISDIDRGGKRKRV